MGASETPPLAGWSRVLYLQADGKYEYWEHDSVANYLLGNGTFTVHLGRGMEPAGSPVSLWVEMAGWRDALPSELITFIGRDTIQMYPGGRNTMVADALTHTYVRDAIHKQPAPALPTDSAATCRPPRLRTLSPGTYFADLEPRMWELRVRASPFFEWMDWQYPASVRKSYRYAHNQIPSAVVGDFDGDGSMDVAIHGSTGYVESKVLCLFANRGRPTSLLLLSEPTLLESGGAHETNRFREPHPTLYLKLLPRGQVFHDSLGNPLSLPRDVILVVRPEGYATPYYYADGEFRRGKARPEQAWDPWGPREQ